MKRKIKLILKKIFWKMPVKGEIKEKIRLIYATKKDRLEENRNINDIRLDKNISFEKYSLDILKIPEVKSEFYKEYEKNDIGKNKSIYIAYYLTQFHPNEKNDEWWGKGTTEWTNVSKAVPQFINHYQPRLPGELGYYDLRVKENMIRQIELAKNYGVDVFCYYYYWFDGERLLEKPLNTFLEDKNLDMPFCLCWANENWTKRFSGTNEGILMKMGDTIESYKSFINDIITILEDNRYFLVNKKPVLLVYRPSLIPEPNKVLKYWREYTKEKIGKDLYIIAVQEKDHSINWIRFGFDAETQFQPKSSIRKCKDITSEIGPIRRDFSGNIYDYKDLVENRRYDNGFKDKKVYPAVMPMWDNTARRNNKGTIFYKSSPNLYEIWLNNSTKYVLENKNLDSPIVFINAWNEWGEGAYLEPDRFYGYAYLQATKNAKL